MGEQGHAQADEHREGMPPRDRDETAYVAMSSPENGCHWGTTVLTRANAH